jgi:hypothetical protein
MAVPFQRPISSFTPVDLYSGLPFGCVCGAELDRDSEESRSIPSRVKMSKLTCGLMEIRQRALTPTWP